MALAHLLVFHAAATSACGRIGFEVLDLPEEGGVSSAVVDDAGTLEAGTLEAGALDAAASDGSAALMDAEAQDAGADAEADVASTAVCGNAVVELGEACDDGVASAACDADCTFAACGDGVVNMLAGEQCDSSDQLSSCSANCVAPTCRVGCSCEFFRGVRYMFCAEALAWEPARQACLQVGMRLVRIRSATEQTYLRLRTQQSGFPKFHLGASDLASEGTWVWTDGTVFWRGVADGTPVSGEFAVWSLGEPNAFVVEENCSEVQSIQGWNDCVCDIGKPFVCKEDRDLGARCGDGIVEVGEVCDDAGESMSCDADCSPAVCGDGVANRTAGERCDDARAGQYCSADCTQLLCPAGCSCLDAAGRSFAVCGGAASFRDAAVACGGAGMTLAHVDDATVDQALRSAATGAGMGEYWIGVFDLDRPNHWLRSDLSLAWDGTAAGTAYGYTHFASGAPSGATDQDCAAVLPNGHWQDRNCSLLKPYVCERF